MRLGLALILAVLCVFAGAQTICIDPGHPSEVGEGTTGKQISEMEVAWKVAQRLKTKLQQLGMKVVMTKSSLKQFVTNRRRAEIANAAKADYMVRLHCDSSSGSGFASFYPARKGTANGTKGPDDDVIERSARMARPFHQAFASTLKGSLRDQGLKTDAETRVGAIHGGALIGSIFSKVPVVLVEMVVLTNPRDEAFVLSNEGLDKLAQGLTNGILAALKKR